MELGPIGGFRPVTASEPKVTDIELTAVSQIDSSHRPGKYSSSRRQSTGRQDADYAELVADDSEHSSSTGEDDPGSQISIFA